MHGSIYLTNLEHLILDLRSKATTQNNGSFHPPKSVYLFIIPAPEYVDDLMKSELIKGTEEEIDESRRTFFICN